MKNVLFLSFVLLATAVSLGAASTQRGACCSTKSAANCIDAQTIGDCVSKFSGVYLGDNKKCSEGTCAALPGACCSKTDGSCHDNVELKRCSGTAHSFAGFGTKCGQNTCEAPARNKSNKPVVRVKSASVSAEATFEIVGRVRDSKTRLPIANAVVAVLDKNHVRVAEAKADAKGEYKVAVQDSSKAPFTVVLSEKQTRDAKNKRCARAVTHNNDNVITSKQINAAKAHKHIVRDLVAQCGGGSVSSHKSSAKLQPVRKNHSFAKKQY